MPKVRDVLAALEEIAPTRYAFPGDKIGLQVGDPNAEVTRAFVSLDRSLGAVNAAKAAGADLLLAHHPLIYAPMTKLDTSRHDMRTVLALASSGINFIAAHTNWDSARGGINDALVELLGLQDVGDCGTASEVPTVRIVTEVPAASHGKVNEVLATFRAARHTSGLSGDEVQVVITLPEEFSRRVMAEIRRVCAKSIPTFEVTPLAPVSEQAAGRIGKLPEPMNLVEFSKLVNERLDTVTLAWGEPTKVLKKVAVVGGAADFDWTGAQRAGADVFLTGEVKQHIALEASESGLCMLASGHYATEQPGVVALAKRMQEMLPEVTWDLCVPEKGLSGRPLDVA